VEAAVVVVAAAVGIDFHKVVAVGCHSNFRLVAVAADTVDFRSVVGCHSSFHLEAAVPAARYSETLVALLVVRMLQVVIATQPLVVVEDLAVAEGGHQLMAEEGLQEAEAILQERPTLV
jgi:hypothetical protein